MKSNYSSWPILILFLHFKFHFLLFFTVPEQEFYCCAKSAKKITPDGLSYSSLKKQKTNCLVSGQPIAHGAASVSTWTGGRSSHHPLTWGGREPLLFPDAWACLCSFPEEGAGRCSLQCLLWVGHTPLMRDGVRQGLVWLILLLDKIARSCLFQFSSNLSHFVEEKDLI